MASEVLRFSGGLLCYNSALVASLTGASSHVDSLYTCPNMSQKVIPSDKSIAPEYTVCTRNWAKLLARQIASQ